MNRILALLSLAPNVCHVVIQVALFIAAKFEIGRLVQALRKQDMSQATLRGTAYQAALALHQARIQLVLGVAKVFGGGAT
jgi:hypothetical protein